MSLNEYEELQLRIKELEYENAQLKELLVDAGILYTLKPFESKCSDNHMKPIEITEERAVRFFSMFWGRTDVYSKRYVSKKTGASGYSPQCENLWSYECPKRLRQKIRCVDCEYKKWKPLGREQIMQHLQGKSENEDDVIGVYPIHQDGDCRFLVFDFDDHNKSDLEETKPGLSWQQEVDVLREICEKNKINLLVERSRSGNGAHLWIFFEKPVEAATARKFGFALLNKGAEFVNIKSFKYYDRMIPAQDRLPEGGLGNLIALPLQGRALARGNSAFVDENWNAYIDQWDTMLATKKISKAFVNDFIKDWSRNVFDGDDLEKESKNANKGEKTWDKKNRFLKDDVLGKIQIVLSDSIYVEVHNLKPRLQNTIRRMAAFDNPKYFKNQAIGLSNYENSRYIYLGSDEGDYIRIPRGLYDELIEQCMKSEIECDIRDERSEGRAINVKFKGALKDSQQPAVDKLLEYNSGILSAATAFGKTVVCTDMIAERKVSTLILLQSSTLIDQWENALMQFLDIDEAPPQYVTPSGRVKRRKSVIGKIQGAHDSSTGIIDIAMVGSLLKKGEFHERLKSYGMVILDECHHAASKTIINVLNEVKAKYVYGVTATPTRSDGLEKINYMMIGPIRYIYSAKERAMEQGIAHYVYPRFTRAVVPYEVTGRMHPNEAYEIVRHNNVRDELIINDVKKCIDMGRTPVILSKYVDHAETLYRELESYAKRAFLLIGTNSKKEHKRILEKMQEVPPDETMILVATGKLIGEGFDYPRLDTLVMATPVSSRSVVEQYAGRLNRDYEGKKSVIVYDYVDAHIPSFNKMYSNRLRAYKQIGYEIYVASSNDIIESEQINSIYDMDNYHDVLQKDMLSARKEIIISSPAISTKKVDEIIDLLNEQQALGIRVSIITWEADVYGYGDSGKWAHLHEQMRQAGFLMKYAEDHCERFIIIDRELVWYGSMNFLAKENTDDNLMRIRSAEIAAELMELAFH